MQAHKVHTDRKYPAQRTESQQPVGLVAQTWSSYKDASGLTVVVVFFFFSHFFYNLKHTNYLFIFCFRIHTNMVYLGSRNS